MLRSCLSLILPLTALIAGAAACTPETDSDALDARFSETLRLGSDDPDAPDHALFTHVTDVATDTAGRIYLADAAPPRIQVYDRDGTFLRSIGRAGGGPGEFERVGALHVDRHHRLLVADPSRARITVFTLQGELIDTYAVPEIQRITQVREFSDGRFLVVGAYDEHLVHVLSSDFQTIEASLVPIEAVRLSNERLEAMWIRFTPGHVQPLGSRTFVFAPSLYTGRLFWYEQQEDETWQRTKTLEGRAWHANPVTFTPLDRAERVDAPFIMPDGRYAAQFHMLSQGLFRQPDGQLVHASMQEADGHLDLVAEFFDAGGTHRGHAVVDTTSSLNVWPLAMDGDGALYLSDTRDYPQLLRMTVKLE